MGAGTAPASAKAHQQRLHLFSLAASGFGQGLAFVTIPAASTVLQDQDSHGLTSSQYGSLFVPMVLLTIVASSLAVGLARRWTVRHVFLVGLTANLASMCAIALSQLMVDRQPAAYGILLGAMACLGIGMGFTLTALNTLVMHLFRDTSGAPITALHAIVGSGNALAPLLAAAFLGIAKWWLLPVSVGATFAVLLLLEGRRAAWIGHDLDDPVSRSPSRPHLRLEAVFWIFAGVAILYGACESIFASWGTTLLHDDMGHSSHLAEFALSAFWAMLVVGRVAVVALCRWVSARWIYLALPILLFIAFLVVPHVDGGAASIAAFGFAGLACSAFFPLTLNFSNQKLPGLTDATSGGLTAAVTVGIGLGAFGVGPLRGFMDLSTIYVGASAMAMLITLTVLPLTRPRGMAA